MKTEQELREIFMGIKGFLEANHEMGLEPPPLSHSNLKYLETDIPFPDRGSSPLDGSKNLMALRNVLGNCTRCKLHQARSHLVFGEGSSHARLVFVGEGPGREEDLEGKPFVGEAGKLLTRIIQAMGLTRQEIYICNVVKCRPPRNREPEKDEIESCLTFLKRQLSIIQPEVICTLGRVAGKALLGENFRISSERGKWHTSMEIPVMPTYHPAYLLRNPSAKRQVWEDVQKVMHRLGLEVKKNG